MTPPPNDSGCVEEWCDEFPPPSGIGGYQYVTEGIQYTMPCYNPNNADEFLYVRTGSVSATELVKFNLQTKQEMILCTTPFIISDPEWSTTGWITFSSLEWKVWKIYEDGSQLTQLTFGENDQNPHFTFNGDKIIYARLKNYSNDELITNPDLYKEYKMIIIDIDGAQVDSILAENINNAYSPYFSYQSWNVGVAKSENEFVFVGGSMPIYGVYSLSGTEIVSVKQLMNYDPVLDIEVEDDFAFYSRYKIGLFKTNLSTGEEIKFKWGCDARSYSHISISPNGNDMLVQKIISSLDTNSGVIDVKNEIWLLDVNGCGEEKILGH